MLMLTMPLPPLPLPPPQVTEHPATLRHIPSDLMTELLTSPHLYVMQTEFSVYVMLKVILLLPVLVVSGLLIFLGFDFILLLFVLIDFL